MCKREGAALCRSTGLLQLPSFLMLLRCSREVRVSLGAR